MMKFVHGSMLFHAGQACSGFVVVHSGTIKVMLTAENGREIILYRVGPGEVCLQTFGCLVNGTSYSAEGKAETDLEIEIIPVGEFQRLVVQDANFRQQLFAAVASRFADLERLVEDVALSPIETRMARALLRMMDNEGQVTATQESLATEIGSVREVVSRQLNGFARDGLVELARGHITVLDPKRLVQLSHPSI
ncbi:Crp/Fnr family transcriptional regulator [Novosphingobium sp. ERN07]|uniref:Crp/Fnr family transcriptional regulator n=1 Tax=Novosphingobium sp. ERN07 TaxID=2726187 RepID=UPI0014563C75|nr:Crp/Fnr family transcriptional regulator [Novosphingobium sp. ERN07]NLR72157.1 Crp/Fnr family transcriptional regulator [Novosphingobium sp. ERN07]